MEQQNNKKPEGNIHPDNSVLSRNSQLYRPEDTRTTREKLKSMKFTDKVVFIVQYYGLKILAVIAAIALVIYLIVHFAFAKEVVLNIVAVNAQDIATTSAADEQSFYEDFLKTHVEDTDDAEVGIASNVSVSEDESNSAGMQNLQAIQGQLMQEPLMMYWRMRRLQQALARWDILQILPPYCRRMCWINTRMTLCTQQAWIRMRPLLSASA